MKRTANKKKAQTAPKMKMTTKIPAAITTPDKVETRLGTLKFFDGLPDKVTVEKVYDNLDFMRGVDVFLNTMAAASTLANIEGLKSVGCNNQTVVIHENRVDAKTLLLTPNTQTATLWFCLNLSGAPMVMEVPPGVLGGADDLWMRFIVDMGFVGPDKGKGGKYLFLPPGYTGNAPEGYFVAQSRTYNVWVLCAASPSRATQLLPSPLSRSISDSTRWRRRRILLRQNSSMVPGCISTPSTRLPSSSTRRSTQSSKRSLLIPQTQRFWDSLPPSAS